MGGGYLGNAGAFLIQTVFGLYILAVMLRFLLQVVRADYYNPLSQFLVKITAPVLTPLRRLIPGILGLDMAAVVLMLVLQFVELVLMLLIKGTAFQPLGLLVLSITELLQLGYYIFLFAIIIQAILSWVHRSAYNPITAMMHQLTEPLLGPARRLLPPISGMDLSPLIVLVALQLAAMLLLDPLRDLGWALTIGR